MSRFQETNLNYATDVDVFLPYVTMGSEVPFTEALSTVTLIRVFGSALVICSLYCCLVESVALH